jgi:hypothetical protein
MRHTADETACLLVVILIRSGQNRARVSAKTMKFLAKRKTLRGAFLNELRDALAEHGWVLCELETGYGVEKSTLLEAAKAVTAKRWLDEDIRRDLRRGRAIDFGPLEKEILPDESEPDEDE